MDQKNKTMLTKYESLYQETIKSLLQLASEVRTHIETGIEKGSLDREASERELKGIDLAISNAGLLLKSAPKTFIYVAGGFVQSIKSSTGQSVLIYDYDLASEPAYVKENGTIREWGALMERLIETNEIKQII